MFERFSDRARRVLVLAQEESRLLDHHFIGTEHILLGLVREREGLASMVLGSFGVTYERAHEVVVGLTTTTSSGDHVGSPPFTPQSKRSLELALREALKLGHNYIGTEHLLLGILGNAEGVAGKALTALGIDAIAVRAGIIEQIQRATPESSEHPGPAARFGPGVERPQNPIRVLAGPDARLLADGEEFRVIGLLLFADGVRVLWRTAGGSTPVGVPIFGARRGPFGGRPGPVEHGRGRTPTPLGIADDLGTAYEHLGSGVEFQPNGEWAGSSYFTPTVPDAATRLEILWRDGRIPVDFSRDR